MDQWCRMNELIDEWMNGVCTGEVSTRDRAIGRYDQPRENTCHMFPLTVEHVHGTVLFLSDALSTLSAQ